MSDNWFTEKHTPHSGLTLEVGNTLFDQHSDFQHIQVLETLEFGRMLLLDGCVMLTDRDEHVYHEMIAHPALLTHPDPKSVLIVGGGDGGSVREVLKHETVESVHLVEIDEAVINTSRQFFPALATGLDDPRVSIHCQDGFAYLDAHQDTYDIILVDSIDPVGEAAKLFTSSFYGKVRGGLRQGGTAVFQSESPFYSGPVLGQLVQKLRPFFPHVAPYLAFIPTYPSGLWSFTFASDCVDPKTIQPRQTPSFLKGLKYFNGEILSAAFTLPNFIRDQVQG